MKYDQETALKEILVRGERLRKRREKTLTRTLAASSAALFTLLILCVGTMSGKGSTQPGRSTYGAFLLPAEAGAYVLTGALAFVGGVIVTMLCVKARERQETQLTVKERDSE